MKTKSVPNVTSSSPTFDINSTRPYNFARPSAMLRPTPPAQLLLNCAWYVLPLN